MKGLKIFIEIWALFFFNINMFVLFRLLYPAFINPDISQYTDHIFYAIYFIKLMLMVYDFYLTLIDLDMDKYLCIVYLKWLRLIHRMVRKERVGGICIICQDEIDPYAFVLQIQSAVDIVRHKDWLLMRTPCNHVYHSSCLLLWIKTNLICPIDRHPIPFGVIQ
jgi:hypothetical protein